MQNISVVVDANNQLHRVYHSMQADGAARWWIPFLDAVCNELAGGERLNVYVAFDGARGTAWRRELEPTYKSKRGPKEPELTNLLAQASFIAMEAGYQVFNVPDAEADDLVAALATRTKSKVVMVSSDKDLFQLLEAGRVNQLRKFSVIQGRLAKHHWYTAQDFTQEYKIDPRRWPLWKAIAGDKSDCLDGVPRCGDTCATNFCMKYATVAEIAAAGVWDWPVNRSHEQPAIQAALKSGSLAKWEQVTTLRRDCLDLVLCEGGA